MGQLALAYLYMVFIGQPPQCFGIGHLLVLHDEAHGRTALATGETLTDIARGRHVERRCGVVVEGTQTLIAGTTLTERHEL